MTLPAEVVDVLEGRARWAVVHADCREVLAALPARSVHHIITDPPYRRGLYLNFRSNSAARTKSSATGRDLRTDAYQALADLAIGALEDVLPFAGAEFRRIALRWIVAFHDAESGHLWRDALGSDYYVRSGVWVKPNPVPQISGDRPGQGFEAATIGHRPGRKRWNGGGKAAVWTHNAVQGNWTERRGNTHPCPKPLSLMLELGKDFSDADDIILDPFAGSGTTGVAALRLGRRCILVERDERYAALARQALEAESRGISRVSYAAGQLPLLQGL